MSDSHWLEETDDGVELCVYARPRASRTQVCGLHGGRLKIQLASPPVDGEANKALVGFLAEVLSCSKRDITIMSGEKGKRKRIRVRGCTFAQVMGSTIGEFGAQFGH